MIINSPHIIRHFHAVKSKKINKNSSEIIQEFIPNEVQSVSPKVMCEQIIRISNKLSKYKLVFGSQFKDCLEPRDQVLEHQFDFSLSIPGKAIQELNADQLPLTIHENIKKFLVESVSNSTSAAFKFLCKGDLSEQQAKEYASKNIFLNTNSIIRETMKGVKGIDGIEMRLKEEDKIKTVLSKEGLSSDQIEHTLEKNWDNLKNYSQTLNAEGINVDKLQEKLSLISLKKQKFTQNLTFNIDNLMSDILVHLILFAFDLLSIIKEVISTAIRVTQSSKDDYKQRTVKEIFNEFNQKLFCIAQEDNYHPIIKSLDEEEKQMQHQTMEMKSHKSFVNIAEDYANVVQFFNETLNRERSAKSEKIEEPWKQIQITKKNETKKQLSFQELDMKNKLEQFRSKNDKTYAFGQKIPEFVKQFNRQEIANQQFTARHSSILRILTKWSEYLQEIFTHPQKSVLGRSSHFKTIDNKLVLLNQTQKLIRQLKSEYQQVKKKYQTIVKNCYKLMGQLLSEQKQSNSSVNRFSDTRAVASKANAILTHHMLTYTNILIHHLLRAGQGIKTNYGSENINLLVFRVSDLLRAKLQCSQNGFISLLKTMYLLDKDISMKDKFKLVRIKSKLDDPANNVMINYLFMGKVQCELQLSIQQPKGKAKNYYAFSHFVYQLTRGKFGAIAQCAIMISQLDPMIVSCKQSYYVQKKGSALINFGQNRIENDQQNQFQLKLKGSVFQCSLKQCKKIIINQSQIMFKDENHHKVCNQCIIAHSQQPEDRLKNEKLKLFLKSKQLKRILSFGELQKEEKQKYVAILSNQGKLAFNIAVFVKEELKTFLVRFDSQTMQQLNNNCVDFGTLDYFDVSKKSQSRQRDQKIQQKQQLMFIIENPSQLSDEVFRMMELNTKPSIEKLKDMAEEFKRFRLEKALIKTIKFNVGVINTDSNLFKWETLNNIDEQLASPPNYQKSKQIRLKYNKYKHLDLSTINQINARSMKAAKEKQTGLTILPQWFAWMKNLKQATLIGNSLQVIKKQNLPTSLIDLNLAANKITECDARHLTNLIKINLANNRLTSIEPDYFKNLTNLKQLYLQKNQIKIFKISNIMTLETLNIAENGAEQIEIIDLINLKEIYMHQNKPKLINLINLNALITANITKNNLQAIDISKLTELKQIFLGQNQLKHFDLSMYKNLTEAYISSNKLETVKFSSHPNLKQISLKFNQLKEVDLSNIKSLNILDISRNSLKTISIAHLANLKQLYLCQNQLLELDMSPFSHLNKAILNKNKLASIKFSHHDSLILVDLQENDLKEVDLRGLPNLIRLNISINKLERIELSKCSLETLKLSSNQLSQIDLNQLYNLKFLYISSNKLTSIDLSRLSGLKQANLSQNPLKKIELTSNISIYELKIFKTQLDSIEYLPESIIRLFADRKDILNYNFEKMTKLRKLQIYKGFTKREELKNLRPEAQLKNNDTK